MEFNEIYDNILKDAHPILINNKNALLAWIKGSKAISVGALKFVFPNEWINSCDFRSKTWISASSGDNLATI